MNELATKVITEALVEAGVDFVASLPEGNYQPLIARIEADPRLTHVPLAREEEGVGICAGAYLGGKRPALLIMNAGFLDSTNALATTNLMGGIPLLLLIGYSGGLSEFLWMHSQIGVVTEPVLRAMGIVFERAEKLSDVAAQVFDAHMLASITMRPVALLLNKECLR
ncbi:MAG TPA: thiamine pyrophosphate-binding protein [Acidimicrobiales bacterium]|nr:thiamine pyrophosphate-binding protein [Acidimicrobiales bacterium]